MSSSGKSWLIISASFAFILFIITASIPFIGHVKSSRFLFQAPESGSFSASRYNVWADLSKEEADGLMKFLFSKADLNLTESSKAQSHDNSILLLEVLQPNKTDVLAYLNGISGPPQRWARVVIDEGANVEARYVYYMVGPLQLGESMQVLPLDFCHSSGKNYVVNPPPDELGLQKFSISFYQGVSDILKELLGEHVDLHNMRPTARISYIENDSSIIWIQLHQFSPKSDATALLSQGLYMKLNSTTRDPSNWKVTQWFYNSILYESDDDLREAMKSPNFQKATLNLESNWTDVEDFKAMPPGREKPPPVMIQPQGPRYCIDKKENFVSWMGFEFFLSTSLETGVTLHDVRFNGESVIYELGMQEAIAHYAGSDPNQSGQVFFDTMAYMGLDMFELVPGYDCPAYASYLSTQHRVQEFTVKNKNSICIFEYTADHPLQRHTAPSGVSISRNTYLVVRFVSTVWNYDYTFDYIFYLDGAIEVKVRASGFIFGAFWTGKDVDSSEYGYRIHDAAASSLHDHVINFKADLDIAGTANTMVKVGIEPMTKSYPWDEENARPRNTMHLVNRPVEKEMGIDWPKNSAEMFIVLNKNTTNAWGENRGYRVQAGTGMGNPAHLAVLNSTTIGRAAEWAYRDLWVVKQKDTEPRSAHPMNSQSPSDPLVDFGAFINDEDVEQEDLVVYFNLGMHHVPHSGDVPNTLMHTSSSSVMFTPFNFHDRDPSRRTTQGVKLELDTQKTQPKYFGGTYDEGMDVKKADVEPDLTKYGTEERVRTYINDRLFPFFELEPDREGN